ncbi:MAG: T9SS type A sorting domain-containing protein, partial [Bacteroidota bacterium]|nr:T9SS type A sorting domain-containing protein [Bacteroidota bacterium]
VLTDTINPWVIDESNPDNIWQIGESHKTILGPAGTPPNAIMTDTINPYPINNHSTFQYLITKPENMQDNCISLIRLIFYYKIDTDTLKDGGYIDISFDMGTTWVNIIDDTISTRVSVLGQFYGSSDTLIGNRKGFSGNRTNEWISSGVEWQDENNEHARTNDSILVRFNFVSDEIDTGKEGWIIDYIYLEVVDLCDVGIDDLFINNEILLYPNPVDGISVLVLPDDTNIYHVQIFDIRGQEILNCISNESFEIYRSDFNPGIYIYKISSSQAQTYTGKFIIK